MIEVFERLALHHDSGILWSAIIVLAMLFLLLRRTGGNGNRRTD